MLKGIGLMDNRQCIAIDCGERSKAYVEAAKKMNVNYVIVDCHADDIMNQLKGVSALVWHWSQSYYTDKRIAKSILTAAAKKGIKIYPDFNTCNTFDDKIAQKYMLEAIAAPLAPYHVFYKKKEALQYLENCSYPVVVKLAGGAASSGVSLIRNFSEGKKVCNKRFRSHVGLSEIFGNKKNIKEMLRYFLKADNERFRGLDKGYVLLQDFLPDNDYDIRVTVIGKKAVIFRRYVRDNDFRASGSGKIDYNVSDEDKQAILIGFKIAESLSTQTLALDFAYDREHSLKIIEISYGFVSKAVSDAGGYYDNNLTWYGEPVETECEVLKMLQQN